MNLLNFRPTEADLEIIEWLKAKMGLGYSQIIRVAIRLLYKREQKS